MLLLYRPIWWQTYDYGGDVLEILNKGNLSNIFGQIWEVLDNKYQMDSSIENCVLRHTHTYIWVHSFGEMQKTQLEKDERHKYNNYPP